MLRYFIAWNLWFAAAVLMILGSDYKSGWPGRFSVFGVGNLIDIQFWLIVIACVVIGVLSFIFWFRTLRGKVVSEVRRGFDVEEPQTDAAAVDRPGSIEATP